MQVHDQRRLGPLRDLELDGLLDFEPIVGAEIHPDLTAKGLALGFQTVFDVGDHTQIHDPDAVVGSRRKLAPGNDLGSRVPIAGARAEGENELLSAVGELHPTTSLPPDEAPDGQLQRPLDSRGRCLRERSTRKGGGRGGAGRDRIGIGTGGGKGIGCHHHLQSAHASGGEVTAARDRDPEKAEPHPGGTRDRPSPTPGPGVVPEPPYPPGAPLGHAPVHAPVAPPISVSHADPPCSVPSASRPLDSLAGSASPPAFPAFRIAPASPASLPMLVARSAPRRE